MQQMPKRLILAALLGGACLMGGAASAEGPDVAQSHDLRDFTGVDASGVFTIEVAVGGDYRIDLSGPEEEMSCVTVAVERGVLKLKQERKKGMGDRDAVRVAIALPALTSFDLSGVGDADITGVDSPELTLRISGVGELEATGRCGALEADVSGVGELDAGGLECADVDVSVSGVGEASVYASRSVKARVSGMGEISVDGQPETVEKKGGLFSSIEVK